MQAHYFLCDPRSTEGAFAFPLLQWLRERATLLRYTDEHSASTGVLDSTSFIIRKSIASSQVSRYLPFATHSVRIPSAAQDGCTSNPPTRKSAQRVTFAPSWLISASVPTAATLRSAVPFSSRHGGDWGRALSRSACGRVCRHDSTASALAGYVNRAKTRA